MNNDNPDNNLTQVRKEAREKIIRIISPSLQGFSNIMQTVAVGVEGLKVFKEVADQTIGLINGFSKQLPSNKNRKYEEENFTRSKKPKRIIPRIKLIVTKTEEFIEIYSPEYKLSAKGSSVNIAIDRICNKIESADPNLWDYDILLEEKEYSNGQKSKERKSSKRC